MAEPMAGANNCFILPRKITKLEVSSDAKILAKSHFYKNAVELRRYNVGGSLLNSFFPFVEKLALLEPNCNI